MTDLQDDQTTPCPPWCEQVQCREIDPADRFHQRIAVVPVVHGEVGGVAAAAELAVVISTSAAKADEVWIGLDLGEGAASITVSVEKLKAFAPSPDGSLLRSDGRVLGDLADGGIVPFRERGRCVESRDETRVVTVVTGRTTGRSTRHPRCVERRWPLREGVR